MNITIQKVVFHVNRGSCNAAITRPDWSVLFREIVTVYSECHANVKKGVELSLCLINAMKMYGGVDV
jgi:hypothetical protein